MLRIASCGFLKKCLRYTLQIVEKGFICVKRICLHKSEIVSTEGLLQGTVLQIAAKGLLCYVIDKCKKFVSNVSTQGLLTKNSLQIAVKGLLCIAEEEEEVKHKSGVIFRQSKLYKDDDEEILTIIINFVLVES